MSSQTENPQVISTRNVLQRMNAVMNEIAYVQKDKKVSAPGASYSAVSHDQVVSMIRHLLVKHGLIVYPEQLESTVLVQRDLKADIKMMLYEGMYNIHIVNIDDANDRVTVKIAGHAADNGDKAPGKAVTYATKSALLKAFCIETGENDESRHVPEAVVYMSSKEQRDEFAGYLKKLEADPKKTMDYICQKMLKIAPVTFAELTQQQADYSISILKARLKQQGDKPAKSETKAQSQDAQDDHQGDMKPRRPAQQQHEQQSEPDLDGYDEDVPL